MQEENSELSVCPSFSSYSSDGLTDIAAQVTREFGGGQEWRRQVGDDCRGELEFRELDNNDDFEFVSVSKADDVVVFDGQLGPVFPIFNRDLLVPAKIQPQTNFADDPKEELEGHDALSLRVPLEKLFVEETDPSPRFSTSSEEDVEAELNGVPPGTYCIWTPNNNNSNNNSPKASPRIKCKKSSSTGTGSSSSASKRWRLLSSFHRRCNSEGKDRLVFLTPKKEEIIKAERTDSKEKKLVKKAARPETMLSAHEVFYVRNRAMKEGEKRRTYLPYRQDLVGFWTSVGTLGRSLPPF